jgi:hypothetical protein
MPILRAALSKCYLLADERTVDRYAALIKVYVPARYFVPVTEPMVSGADVHEEQAEHFPGPLVEHGLGSRMRYRRAMG